jgi:hypothetical protein
VSALDLHKCRRCGGLHEIYELDSKPTLDRRLKRIRRAQGPLHMLTYAADHGYDFDWLECARCYGPGYEASP